MWEPVWRTLVDALGQDFAEFRDVAGLVRVAVRLMLAAVLGGILGLERTVRNRPAGLRTHMLVSLGSASFVLGALGTGVEPTDLARVIQGLITGVGFLGAGVIVKSDVRLEPRGLTTAAGIWLTAAVGMAAGLGRPATALLTAVLGLIVLAPLRRLEERVDRRFQEMERAGGGPRSGRSP